MYINNLLRIITDKYPAILRHLLINSLTILPKSLIDIMFVVAWFTWSINPSPGIALENNQIIFFFFIGFPNGYPPKCPPKLDYCMPGYYIIIW